MYQIKCLNGAVESYLYDARVKEYAVIAPHLALELNKSGLLTFGVPDSHPNRDQIIPLMSDIVVYEDDVAIWYGRSITNEKDFYKTGKITCEGELAFLYDSIYRPFSYTGTITQFLTNLINNHNSQVETRKEFTLGTVSVVDSNGNVARSSEDALKTLDIISTRLLSTNGGYLRVRHVGAVRYLDYLADYGNTAPQVIEFAKNLIDINQFIDATKVRTCLIPYGAEVTGSATGERVDITTVNGGLDYISNSGAVASYGQIWETVTFKDVTIPANLYAKALVYLGEMVAQSLTLKLSAVDLSVLGVETSIGIGDWVRVKSAPHGLDSLFLATARNIDMASPESTKIAFGNVTQSFTTQNNQAKLDVSKSVDDVSARVLLATQLITGAVGGHVVFDPPEKPSRILIMDTADMTTAQNVWQFNVNGLGFSSTGVNGTYKTAMTMDGQIVSTATINGKAVTVSLNSTDAISITVDGVTVFNVNSAGKITITDDAVKQGVAYNGVTIDATDGFVSSATFGGNTYTVKQNAAEGFSIYKGAVKILGIDSATGKITITDDAVKQGTGYGGVSISAADGFVASATIDGKAVAISMNATDGIDITVDAVKVGGLVLIGGKVAFVGSILCKPGSTDTYISLESDPDDGTLDVARFYAPNSGSAAEFLRIGFNSVAAYLRAMPIAGSGNRSFVVTTTDYGSAEGGEIVLWKSSGGNSASIRVRNGTDSTEIYQTPTSITFSKNGSPVETW